MADEKDVTEIAGTSREKESFFAGESIEHENNDGELTGANRQKESALTGEHTEHEGIGSPGSDEDSKSDE